MAKYKTREEENAYEQGFDDGFEDAKDEVELDDIPRITATGNRCYLHH